MGTGRRVSIVVLLATCVIAVAGCGPAKNAASPTVSMAITDSKLDFAKELGDGFLAGANDVGGVSATVVGLDIRGGPAQIARFQELTKTARGGVAVETLAPEEFAAPLAAAAKGGTPLVAVDTAPAPGSQVRLYVGNDNYSLGAALADEAIRRLPVGATGTVVLGTPAPGLPVLDFRAKGMRDEFAKRLPGVRVLGPFDTLQDERANQVAWKHLVATNPTALAFLGTGDSDSFNLAAVRRQTGGRWLAAAFDLDARSLAAVKEGQLFALMSPEHFLKGAIGGNLLARHANGELTLPEGWIYTPGLAVTSANIDPIMRRQASSAARAAWFRPQVARIVKDQKAYLRPLTAAR